MKNILQKPFFKILIIAIIAILISFMFMKLITRFLYKEPNVILITARSLRPDHLSCYGYEHMDTAEFNRLARKGVLFERAYCNTPNAIYSYASILSGRNANSVLEEKGDSAYLKASSRLLSEYLKDAGYRTIAVLSNTNIPDNMGFEKGFDVFDNVILKALRKKKDFSLLYGPTEQALALLNQYKATGDPVFLWLEYSIPGSSPILPEEFEKAKDEHPYDRQVLLLNDAVAELFAGMHAMGMGKNNIVVFTATNGEPFNEHNEWAGGVFVYDSTSRIPLIMRYPGGSQGERVKALASHMDIAPTVLSMVGAGYNREDFDGIDLKRVIDEREGKRKKRSLYLESTAGHSSFGWSPVVAVVSGDYKYIELPNPELYDLKTDPHEVDNIIDKDPEKAEAMRKELLDYVDAERPDLSEILNKGADPKDMITLLRPMTLRGDQLVEYLTEMLSRDPGNKQVKYLLAEVYFNSKDLAKAKEYLLEITKDHPDFSKAWELLGFVYSEEGNEDEAAICYEKAIALNPDSLASLNNLAWYYAEKGINLEKAYEYSEKAVNFRPDISDFVDTFAEVNLKMGNKEKAVELLEKAISIETDPKEIEYLRKRLEEINIEQK